MPLVSQSNTADDLAPPTAALVSLPCDLLLEIASFLEFSSDILHFGISCISLYSSVASALYKSVTLNSPERCINTLRMLSRHPEISCHVQKLIVRPDGADQTQLAWYTRADGLIICSTIRQVAVRLDALNTFVWDAEGVPPNDDIWFALQKSCPQLRNIGSSIGSYMPHHSNLFEFKNLVGFSLTLKPGFYEDNTEEILSEPSFSRLWDMLIDRCPNLEELSINGSSLYPTDARRLVRGRWPKLRKLALGDVSLSDPQASTVDFFNSHRQLQVLHTSRHALPLTLLTPSLVKDHESDFMLPHLTEFGGTLEQLQAVIALGHTSLTTARFPEPMLMHDDHISPQAMSIALRNLPCLTTLSISFRLHSAAPFENGNLLKAIVSSCPRLVHLELGCLQFPSFPVKLFSKAIRNLHKLRTFSLTLVKYSFDEPLHKSAAQLALANPRLHRFTITFNPNINYWLPVPHSIASYPSSYVESGTYTITTDEHGLPVSLSAVERRAPRSLRPIMWMRSSAVIRRYQVDLRPRSLKDSSVGLTGLGLLVMEKSVAGDELRMLLIFVLLFCLAVWGFLAIGSEKTKR